MTNNITTTVFFFHSHLILSSCTSFLLFILSLRFYSASFKHALEMHPDILDLAISTLHYVSWVGQTGSPSSQILLSPISLSCSSGKPHTSWPGDMPASRPCRGPCQSISAHVHSLLNFWLDYKKKKAMLIFRVLRYWVWVGELTQVHL